MKVTPYCYCYYVSRANLPPAPKGPPHLPAPAVGTPLDVVTAPPYTALLAMYACVSTRANYDQTFATGVFMYDFEICKDMSNDDIV